MADDPHFEGRQSPTRTVLPHSGVNSNVLTGGCAATWCRLLYYIICIVQNVSRQVLQPHHEPL